MIRPRLRWKFFDLWLRKLWVLVSVDRLFWPLVVSAVYVPVGPWFVGEVIEDHIGVVFAWGIFVNRSYLPGSLTYAYGFFQQYFTTKQLHCAPQHPTHTHDSAYTVYTVPHNLWHPLNPVSVSSSPSQINLYESDTLANPNTSLLMITAFFFWLAYGTMALFLGPLRTWSAVLGLILWYQAATVHKDVLSLSREAEPHLKGGR
ncbi:Transmembrane protein 62 [Portunus trituberculatus]|uniref:Transmembrane protein 62 n=1 Tax=Portunus trituberculatus TaxID=210409 RepID=A0A5B7GMB5_PORTR|nr:Transmembrane protein 62 [Portunus trituberculatus]